MKVKKSRTGYGNFQKDYDSNLNSFNSNGSGMIKIMFKIWWDWRKKRVRVSVVNNDGFY